MSLRSPASSVVYTGSRQSAIAEVCRKLREVRQLCTSPTNVPAADRISRIEGLAIAAQSLAEVALLTEKASPSALDETSPRSSPESPASTPRERSRSQPGPSARARGSTALVERALDKALQRLVFLETQSRESVAAAEELERRLRTERSRTNEERKGREDLAAAVRQLQEANHANVDSARRWRARAEALEARHAESGRKLREAERGREDAMQRLRTLYLRYQEAQENLRSTAAERAALQREREASEAGADAKMRVALEKARGEFSSREARMKRRISALERQVELLASLASTRASGRGSGRASEHVPERTLKRESEHGTRRASNHMADGEVLVARRGERAESPHADREASRADTHASASQTDSALFDVVQSAVLHIPARQGGDGSGKTRELRESAVVSSLLQPMDGWLGPSIRGPEDDAPEPRSRILEATHTSVRAHAPQEAPRPSTFGTADAPSHAHGPFPRLSSSQLDKRVNDIAQRILREQGDRLADPGWAGTGQEAPKRSQQGSTLSSASSVAPSVPSAPSAPSTTATAAGSSSFRDVQSNLRALSRRLRELEDRE